MMTNEQIISSIKDITDKYETLCNELLENLRIALLENMDLRQQIKDLKHE